MNDPIQQALLPDADCPRLEDLAMAMSAGENDSQHAEAIAHMANCARCRAAYLVQLEFQNAVPTPEEEAVIDSIAARMGNPVPASSVSSAIPIRAPRRRRFWSPRFFTGIAAAAVISVLVIGIRQRNLDHAATIREGNGIYRSAPLQTDTPAGDLVTFPGAFRWSAGKDLHLFVVTVMEVDGTVVYHGEADTTSLALPREVRGLLQPGRTLLWNVKAVDAGGQVIQESKTEEFRLLPAAHDSGER